MTEPTRREPKTIGSTFSLPENCSSEFFAECLRGTIANMRLIAAIEGLDFPMQVHMVGDEDFRFTFFLRETTSDDRLLEECKKRAEKRDFPWLFTIQDQHGAKLNMKLDLAKAKTAGCDQT